LGPITLKSDSSRKKAEQVIVPPFLLHLDVHQPTQTILPQAKHLSHESNAYFQMAHIKMM
jgi:hypothetical protein